MANTRTHTSMSTENLAQKIHYQFETLKRYDDNISSSNVKAGLLLSFLGAMIFGLLMRFIALFGNSPDIFYFLTITFITLTILSTVAAAWFLLATVFPNLSEGSSRKSLVFFGDVATHPGGVEGYINAVFNASSESTLQDISEQVYLVAHIVKNKFENLKKAIAVIKFLVFPLLLTSIVLPFISGLADNFFL